MKLIEKIKLWLNSELNGYQNEKKNNFHKNDESKIV